MAGFDADALLDCYRRGVFPMADARREKRLFLVDPVRRGVLPITSPRISHRLARTVRSNRFTVTADRAFEAVIAACAAPAPGREETWINDAIESLCLELHRRGLAHSLEVWRDGALAGGLYGVAIGGAFFGESMFSRVRDASKVGLVHLLARLAAGGFLLLDAQFLTDHLASLGAVEIPRAEYLRRLSKALQAPADFRRLPPQVEGAAALQAISQRS